MDCSSVFRTILTFSRTNEALLWLLAQLEVYKLD